MADSQLPLYHNVVPIGCYNKYKYLANIFSFVRQNLTQHVHSTS
jgi:hypothetical protein